MASASMLPRLAEQQVNVLRHDHVTVDVKLETAAHTLQPGLENLPGDGCGKRGTTMVAAERHEVSLAGRVKSFQPPRHKASLPPENWPTQAKRRLEWATAPVFFLTVPFKLDNLNKTTLSTR